MCRQTLHKPWVNIQDYWITTIVQTKDYKVSFLNNVKDIGKRLFVEHKIKSDNVFIRRHL